MSFRKMIIILLMFFCAFGLFAEDNQAQGNPSASFSLFHRVSVDTTLSYKFTNSQGTSINSKTLEIGSTNTVGSFYATFNTTRKINIELVWTPLLREGETSASADTAYPYVMTLSDRNGTVLPNYVSMEAGVAASASEFVVYGDYGSGEAFFINKSLTKTSSQMFEDSLICSMTILIDTEDSLPPGLYTGSIYFVTLGN